MKKPIQKVVSSLLVFAIASSHVPAFAGSALASESCARNSCFTTGQNVFTIVNRYGDKSTAAASAYEVAIVNSGSTVAGATAHVSWKDAEKTDFKAKYDPTSGVLDYEVAGTTTTYDTGHKNLKFGEILLYAKGQGNVDVTADSVEINGSKPSVSLTTQQNFAGQKINISSVDQKDGIELQGKVAFDWKTTKAPTADIPGLVIVFRNPTSAVTAPIVIEGVVDPNLTTKLTSDWGSGYCYSASYKNAGTGTIDGWTVTANLSNSTVTSVANSTYTLVNNVLTLKNEAWNARIAPGATVEASYCGAGTGRPSVPKFTALGYMVLQDYSLTQGGLSVSVKTQSNWATGYCRDVTFKNVGSSTLNDWSAKFSLAPTITSKWSANFATSNGVTTLTPLSWNKTLAVGASTTIGFCVEWNQSQFDKDWSIVTPAATGTGTGSGTTNSGSTNTGSTVVTPVVPVTSADISADKLNHKIGTLVSDATSPSGKALFGDKAVDKYGDLVTDTPVSLKAGAYVATFRIKTDNISLQDVIANVGVFSTKTSHEGSYFEVYGKHFSAVDTYTDLKITFNVPVDGLVYSPSVFMPGTTNLSVAFVRIDPTLAGVAYAIDKTQSNTYEESYLSQSVGSVVSDAAANNGKAVLAKPDTDNYGHMVFGPYSVGETPGDHQVSFRMKTDNNAFTGIIARIEAFNTSGDGINKNRFIRGTDFAASNAYQDFTIDYKRTANGKMEFPVLFYKSGSVWVDSITDFGPRADTTPPKIANVTVSAPVLKSFEVETIAFTVSEALSEKPQVRLGNNSADFVSENNGTYVYQYVLSDMSPTPIQEKRDVSIQVTDAAGNTASDLSASVTVNIDNNGFAYESEKLPGSIGHDISDAAGYALGARSVTSADGAGFIQFGPYENKLTPNRMYVAKFRLKTTDNTQGGTYATVDVVNTNGSGNRVFKQVRGVDFTANNAYQDFEVKFLATGDGVMEYRIKYEGRGDVTADRVYVTPDVSTGIAASYESEDLYGVVGAMVDDTDGSKGKAIHAKVGADAPGTFQFGPYQTTLVNKLAYVASFRLKVADNTSTNPIMLIDVYDGNTGYREYREIKATDFDAPNAYQNFDIDFIKPDSSNLEFRVFFYGVQDIWADKVDISEKVVPRLPDYESENLPGLSGDVVVDADASGQMARKARKGVDQGGAVQFGPYDSTNLIDGNAYTASFRLKVADNTASDFIALIDVYNADTGLRKYREIKATDFDANGVYQNFDIGFTKPAGSANMEYRVFFYGAQDIWADKVVVAAGSADGLPVYESESMPSKTGKVIKDANASGGKALTYTPGTLPEGWAQFGPYKVDNANVVIGDRYRAAFKLRTDNNATSEVIALVNVYNSEKDLNYVLPVRGTDFAAANQYQEFVVDFPMADKDMMEFRVYVTGKGQLTMDKVSIQSYVASTPISQNTTVIAKAVNSSKEITTSALRFNVNVSGNGFVSLANVKISSALFGYTGSSVVKVYRNAVSDANLAGTGVVGADQTISLSANSGANRTVDAGTTATYIVAVEGAIGDASVSGNKDWTVALKDVSLDTNNDGTADTLASQVPSMGAFPITEVK